MLDAVDSRQVPNSPNQSVQQNICKIFLKALQEVTSAERWPGDASDVVSFLMRLLLSVHSAAGAEPEQTTLMSGGMQD